MSLDPVLEQQLRAEGALTAPKLDELPLAEALAILRAAKTPQKPPGQPAVVEDRTIPGPDGNLIPVRLYRPAVGGRSGVLLHLHGGGWVGGSLANDDARCHATSQRAGITVASVAYRLAPPCSGFTAMRPKSAPTRRPSGSAARARAAISPPRPRCWRATVAARRSNARSSPIRSATPQCPSPLTLKTPRDRC